jgi:hypothetical protein
MLGAAHAGLARMRRLALAQFHSKQSHETRAPDQSMVRER